MSDSECAMRHVRPIIQNFKSEFIQKVNRVTVILYVIAYYLFSR